MRRAVFKLLRTAIVLSGAVVLTFLLYRIYNSQRGDPLELWHTFVPHEMSVKELDAADWNGYLAAEEQTFRSVHDQITAKLEPPEQVPYNRYFENSPVNPAHFSRDWNRSYLLEPSSAPIGAVVLLHGLTDSPYSLRHIATRYRDRGYVVVAIRLPAHGTAPAALTDVQWESWSAATRLAVREAVKRAPAPLHLHIVGFSNGGSLALKYAFDALESPELPRADRIVLISPMVGVTRFARFAGLAGLPAFFPAFAKAAWLGVLPEFNPFKYNSFPVNGARQSFLLTEALRTQLARLERAGMLVKLPPILTFQSVMDFTVSTPAVLSGLYDHLPANGSELVLFDINRNIKFTPLIRPSADTALARLVPSTIRNYRLVVVTNAGEGTEEAVERVVEAGTTTETTHRLGLVYPRGVFSLSHLALPFPMTDSLYGLTPDPSDNFGVHLGELAPRGERGTLIVSLDALSRMSANPFFPYLVQRIEEQMQPPSATEGARRETEKLETATQTRAEDKGAKSERPAEASPQRSDAVPNPRRSRR
jgi:alpha-beta hydrolase superfamily lysophospholipase